MSRASHPQSRQSIQIEAARLEQKIWAHFVAETRNENELPRAYAVEDHKKQVYIKGSSGFLVGKMRGVM